MSLRADRSPLRRRLCALIGALALVGTMLVPAPAVAASPRHWNVEAGAANSDQVIQVNAFLPRDITIDVNDSITWTNPAGEPHTVTFLSGGAPPPLTVVGPNGPDINPQAAAPAGGSVYFGRDYFNSGFLLQGQSYTLGFGAPGDFPYVCLIHSQMKGEVHVRPAGTPYPKTQQLYNAEAHAQCGVLMGQGRVLEARGLVSAVTGGRDNVTAGIGQLIPSTATLTILRFVPAKRVVHVGETVTWTNRDPEAPHTVTFGTEPAGGPFGALPPSGAIDGPGHGTLSAPGQSVNSGFLAQDDRFQVTFTAPGTYPYICALHDDLGMVGTIQVVR